MQMPQAEHPHSILEGACNVGKIIKSHFGTFDNGI